MVNPAAREPMSPVVLSRYLGQAFPPTAQQAEIIGAEPGPLLVVAGAGAGKTETMAARVVWLVANGYARPDEILGLTFTRKAAQELGKRIRDRLATLASNTELIRRLDPSGELAAALTVIAPSVSTYDSYAGDLIREYGLLVPVEPDARLITDAELHAIAHEVVTSFSGDLLPDGIENASVGTVVQDLLALVSSMGNELRDPEAIRENAEIFLKETEELPEAPKKPGFSAALGTWRSKQELRARYLPLAEALGAELRRRGLVTFNEQMSVAARLAQAHASVGESQRRRFRVVMLDEYQDTSHAQRVLLRSLFGEGRDGAEPHSHPLTVTAVGDPMQAIYGWRGATAANLAAFVEDFPLPDGTPAPKKQLTTSWRNPAEVLTLANTVSDALLGTGENRAVAPLQPREGAGAGDVTLGFFGHEDEEIDFVADNLAAQYAECTEHGREFSAAVLVRKNKTSPEVAEALEARGVPYEVVGLAGLLDVPEVADTVAIATMLVRPHDSAAALRVLAGPAVGLGLKDLDALARRATNLNGTAAPAEEQAPDAPAAGDIDPVERLREQLAELVADAENIMAAADRPAGLTDAVADLGEPERYTEEGLARLRRLASKLRTLRTGSLGKRLPDLFADIISAFGIRTETMVRPSATGTVHLDRLLEEVAAYPGSSVDSLLDYFDLARSHEDGLTPGSVAVSSDRVQILTAHKAKGLEWDTVAVVHADSDTYDAKAETFLTFIKHLPEEEFAAFEEAGDRKEFEQAGKHYIDEKRDTLREEAARLFYVALTRSARKLLITGAERSAGHVKSHAPYGHFESLRPLVPEERVVCWGPDAEAGAADGERGDAPAREGLWPHLDVHPREARAAAAVERARTELPPAAEGELFSLWERDTTALIDEHEAELAAEVPVVIPGELTASDVVAIKADPVQFARRARRPVPFKPNAYAKRGTAFHEWLEEFYGARPLLSEDELPGSDEEDVDKQTLERLKASFEASPWAHRTPAYVEHPFELALGDSVVRGRMDAVFEDADGWTVVDWKTGARPTAGEMEATKLQLAVYREAWRRIAGDGREVRAVFFYVRTGEDYSPADLPDRDQLGELLRQSSAGGLKFGEGTQQ